jgi:hypothetical protein
MARLASCALAALVLCLLSTSPALAHIRLDSPANRYNDQKNGPCGAVSDQRTDRVTVFEPGQTITVEWEETIKHPSHFRIAFSASGTADFEDPRDFDDFYTNDAVLLDNIPDREEAGFYQAQVTLPDIECEDCTLQLIQVMYDKSLANAFYWQCADLVLRAGGGDAGGDAGPGSDADASSGGCWAARGSKGAGAVIVLALLAVYAPRVRRVRAG